MNGAWHHFDANGIHVHIHADVLTGIGSDASVLFHFGAMGECELELGD